MRAKSKLAPLVFVCNAIGPTAGHAQDDAIGDSAGPFLAVIATRSPAADFRDLVEAADVTVTEQQVHTGALQFSIGRTTFEAGIDYQYTRYEYEGIAGRDRDLHRLQIPVHFSRALDSWRLEGYVAPGVSTSSNVFKDLFNRGSGDDVLVNVRLEGQRESAGRNWIVGLAYDRLFGEPTLYPVLGVEWSPRKALDIRLAFPDPAIRYRLSDRLTLLGRLFPAGHEWRVTSDDFSNEFDYRVEAYRAQSSLAMRAWKALTVDLAVGYEFGREHQFNDDTDTRIESRVDDQWFVALGFRLGPAVLPYTHGGHL